MLSKNYIGGNVTTWASMAASGTDVMWLLIEVRGWTLKSAWLYSLPRFK